MKICVVGLWHLGTVTAACLASTGDHIIYGYDSDHALVSDLQMGELPVSEPGVATLIREGIAAEKLHFTTEAENALKDADVIWVTYDTPVNHDDNADVEFVIRRVEELFPYFPNDAIVLISSQLPVGSTRRLKNSFLSQTSLKSMGFAYIPENLRLGKAIATFMTPDRIVIGVDKDTSRQTLSEIFSPFSSQIQWMSIESAEMTKHALNSFLATSITFINEIARVCEQVGADAKEVELGLKSEARIGPGAYLSPGSAYAGGTLARDVKFLNQFASEHAISLPLLAGVNLSNLEHLKWEQNKLKHIFPTLHGKTICVWGLTYKPGTDTLRRSNAIRLCSWLCSEGASVNAHDPAITVLPDELAAGITLVISPESAVQDADALVVATEWPEFRNVNFKTLLGRMRQPIVIDANRFLSEANNITEEVRYFSVGK